MELHKSRVKNYLAQITGSVFFRWAIISRLYKGPVELFFDTSWCGAEESYRCRSLENFGELLRGRVSETEECLDYAKHVTEKPAD